MRGKAGAFAYVEGGQRLEPSLTSKGGKGWSLRLRRGGKGWSLRLRRGAKAGAFAYIEGGKGWSLRLHEGGKGWSLRLRRGGAKAGAFAYVEGGAKAGAFAYVEGGKGWSLRLRRRGQRLEPSLTLDQLPNLLGDGQTQFLMGVGRQMDAIGTVGRDDLRRVEDRDVCRS